ncbi:MAG: glycosyltransferase [Crocinitomicaceae bacterium]|nr:glycosyltransferase [Crocinitomicaceae bacterium]
MKKPKVIVSVINDLYTDQRVDKVCNFLVDQGYDVLLVGRQLKKSLPLPPRRYKTHRMKLFFEKGALFYATYNIRLFLFLIFRRATILLSNDLDTLLANYLAHRLKFNTRLVYDSHEFFTEVPELQGRYAKKVWENIEGWIFPKLTTIYTVNASIADLYQKKYNKELRIVRNVSPLWSATNLLSKEELNLPEDKPIIILQGAGINVDRGAEEAIEAMNWVENAYLIIVGDGDVVSQLKEYVKQSNLSPKVLFYGKQPYLKMMNYTFYASIGLTLDKDTNINYRYSLPNKVFDYIHTNTAIVCTPLVEVKRIIESHEVGVVLEKLTPQNLADTLNSLLENAEKLKQLQHNCDQAKQVLNWQQESEVLKQIYPKIEQ